MKSVEEVHAYLINMQRMIRAKNIYSALITACEDRDDALKKHPITSFAVFSTCERVAELRDKLWHAEQFVNGPLYKRYYSWNSSQ